MRNNGSFVFLRYLKIHSESQQLKDGPRPSSFWWEQFSHPRNIDIVHSFIDWSPMANEASCYWCCILCFGACHSLFAGCAFGDAARGLALLHTWWVLTCINMLHAWVMSQYRPWNGAALHILFYFSFHVASRNQSGSGSLGKNNQHKSQKPQKHSHHARKILRTFLEEHTSISTEVVFSNELDAKARDWCLRQGRCALNQIQIMLGWHSCQIRQTASQTMLRLRYFSRQSSQGMHAWHL